MDHVVTPEFRMLCFFSYHTGSIVRDDDIDLSTLSVIKRVLLNHLLGVPQCGKAVNVEANNIYLKGKVNIL